MRKLENVTVTHVSYVDKAANKKSFFLTKSADEPIFETPVRLITKADDPQKLVYGVVYEPDVEDSHGDYMDAETIEKAAHGFMENYQQIDKQHDFTTNAGKVVESYVAPVDMTVGDVTIAKGTWVLVTKATDDLWEDIQKGEFTGYSLAGTAQVEDVKKETKSVTKQGLIDTVKSFFSTKKSKEDNEMNAEELKKALGEALQPVNDRLEALEKASEKGPAEDEVAKKKKSEKDGELENDEVAKAIAKAVEPLNLKIASLEKSRISNNHEPNYEEIKKSEVASYVNDVFPVEE